MDDLCCALRPGTSTLELSGAFDHDAWALLDEEIDSAFRPTACRLTIDLSRAAGVPPHSVGRPVHLCNRCRPGTIVRVGSRSRAAVPTAPVAA